LSMKNIMSVFFFLLELSYQRTPFRNKMVASSFLRHKRVKRDNLDEECGETESCYHEEVREHYPYWNDYSICDFFKRRQCASFYCSPGTQCVTLNDGRCSKLNNYQVHCIGKDTYISSEDLSVGSCDRNLTQAAPFPGNPVSCFRNLIGSSEWTINDGERICLRYVAKAGGYLVYQDFHNRKYPRQNYTSTTNSSELCVYLDVTPPMHCSENMSCAEDPIQISSRILDNPEVEIMANGWFDPFPVNPDQASKIKSVSLSVHEVKEVNNSTLTMDEKSIPDMKFNVSGSPLKVILPSKAPGLYGLTLEVVDHALNPKYARIFVLFDNSSNLLIRGEKKLRVDTGDRTTNYTWQTHLRDVCLSWHGRYYNSFHVHYNLLRKIKPDYHGFYNGVYEQLSGDLPVKGTVNVDGIVDFMYNWTNVRTKTVSKEKSIRLVTDQQFCDNLGISDGDSFVISITSVDIMKRTLTEDIALNIDSSVPDITDMWVLRNGVRQLFVHNSTELQNMVIEFSILDIHSGIYSIQWQLGTTPHGHELGMGAIAVHRLPESKTSCSSTPNCYCPAIGLCEQHVYQINFNSLVKNNTHIGLHNREYFFALKATNNAQLVSIERTDILVDNSPPEVGVVFEGVNNEKDIDYSSDANLFLNWHGFLDHESGIMKYRVGVDDHCMTSEELLHSNHNASQISHLFETEENVIKVLLRGEGKYYATVIAYNNALQPSEPVCSDGIVYDTTPPMVDNFIIDNGHCREVIACFNNSVYLIMDNFTAVELVQSQACLNRCLNASESNIIKFLNKIQTPSNQKLFSESLCQRLDVLSDNWFIYLPSDKLVLNWNLTEDRSQTREVMIGLATSDKYGTLPDIQGYIQTRRLNTYSRLHNGIDRGVPFYILIKAVNKADLETVASIGPVIIDETPPQYNGGLNVEMDDNFVYITWHNDSFSEMEQKEQFGDVLFRIGNEDTFMTPFYQERVIDRCPIDPMLYCIRYPLYKIQQLDNEKGVQFTVELSVFNIAGLNVRVRSSTFTVPSRFPPTEGVVLDIETGHVESHTDFDFLWETGEICVSWIGFHHHADIDFELGIGTTPRMDDVIPFDLVNGSSACLRTKSLQPWNRYFSAIRASNAAGSSISSSDGFVLITGNKSVTDPDIFDGKECDVSSTLEDVYNTESDTIRININLNMETIYTVHIDESTQRKNFEIESNEVIWIGKQKLEKTTIVQFIPILPNPLFNIQGHTGPYNFSIIQCGQYGRFKKNIKDYQSYWKLPDIIKPYVTHLFVAIVKTSDGNSSSEYASEITKTSLNSVDFHNLNLVNFEGYKVKLSTCFDQICLSPSYSKGVVIDTVPPTVGSIHVTQTEDNLNCTDILIAMDPYKCVASGFAKGYTVHLETPEKSYSSSKFYALSNGMHRNSSVIKEKVCISSPFLQHRSIQACITGVCPSSSSTVACVPLISSYHPNEFDPNTVYEVKTNDIDLTHMQQLMSSNFLEDEIKTVQDKEVDFIKASAEITGLLLNPEGRKISWFLTTSPQVPTLTCSDDPSCVMSINSSNGVGRFRHISFVENQKYFVCAYSPFVTIDKMHHHLKLAEISSCGNGFIVDDSAPQAGEVRIRANGYGFSSSRNMLTLSWYGFDDIEAMVDIGKYEQGISSYSYAIGSYPGGEDIQSFSNVGLQTGLSVTNLSLPNGVQCFATVLARDFVGNEVKSISPGITIDYSAPVTGIIWVGNPYQKFPIVSASSLVVHWEGFYDKDSGIQRIDVGLGSSNVSADLITIRDVKGTSLNIKDIELVDGHYYYSHIITDVDFQRDVTTLCVHWNGFHDPHSKLSYYEVSIGTVPGDTDVLDWTNVGLKTEETWHNLFEAGVKYYTTVRACNKVGLCTDATSDGVIMDNSPPVPGMIHVGRSDNHQQYLAHKSSISARWVGFQDPHSGIRHFTWCLGTTPGLCDIEDYQNAHLASSITQTGLSLPLNKDIYLTVTAYNSVGLNMTRSSDKFRVDVSPPISQSKPSFISEPYMSLKTGSQIDNSLLTLKWNFSDNESPITDYSIFLHTHEKGHIEEQILTFGARNSTSIQLEKDKLLKDGDTYTAWVTGCNAAGLCTEDHSDLLLIDSTPPHLGGFKNMMKWKNKIAGNRTVTELFLQWYGFSDVGSNISYYSLTASRSFSGSELSNGTVDHHHDASLRYQTFSMDLSRVTSPGEDIVLSVSAVNKVGLRSKTGRVTVTLVADDKSGISGFLEIQRHSCKAHYCNNDCTCAVIGQKCLVTNAMKCSNYKNVSEQDIAVHFGLKSYTMNITPSKSCLIGHWNISKSFEQRTLRFEWSMGIDGEKQGEGIFDTLKEDVWQDVGLNTDIVHCLPPQRQLLHAYRYVLYVRSWMSAYEYVESQSRPILIDQTPPDIRKGKSIIESKKDCKYDIDYMNNTDDFYICWSSVFSEQQGHILYYEVYGGSSYKGYDLLAPTNTGTRTSYKVDGGRLNPGTTYYFTVVATNNVNLSTSHTSDGILVDIDRPVTGVVFNTKHHKSVKHHPSLEKLGVSWHGFDDHQSFISHYNVTILDAFTNNNFINVSRFGLKNSLVLQNLRLNQGSVYKIEVTATDAAGHVSDVAVSEEFIVDHSPPYGYRCEQFSEMEISILSFKSEFLDQGLKEHTSVGEVNVTKGEKYKVIIAFSVAPTEDAIYLRINDLEISLKCARNSNGSAVTEYDFTGQTDGESKIRVTYKNHVNNGTLQVFLQQCHKAILDNQQAMTVKQISTDTLYIHTRIRDIESGLKFLRVGLGTSEGGLQIQQFMSLPLNGIINVDLPHGSQIHGRVWAGNNAGLSSVFNASAIIFDKTPPVISNSSISLSYTFAVYDENVTQLYAKQENMTSDNTLNRNTKTTLTNIDVHWTVEDPESGVLECRCLYGSPATSVKGTSDKLLIDWHSVFQSQEEGKLVYVFAVGSRKGYVDIQRPIETMGTNMTVSLEGDTKEIFLSIHAFAPNLEASHYYAMIHT
ncbi:hypothetical protein FSP39_023833, partial [Pinctada imbricata]